MDVDAVATLPESDAALIDFCIRTIKQCDESVSKALAWNEAHPHISPADMEWLRLTRHYAVITMHAIETGKPIPPQCLDWFLERHRQRQLAS